MLLACLVLPISLLLSPTPSLRAVTSLPDAPSSQLLPQSVLLPSTIEPPGLVLYTTLELLHVSPVSSSLALAAIEDRDTSDLILGVSQSTQTPSAPISQSTAPRHDSAHPRPVDVDKNGNPIPLEQQQPHRILGFMPNFRTVSAGAQVHPPGWKYNFTVATHQALDYSTFLFLGLTSLTAEGVDSHRDLGKGVDGFWSYTWRGFLDKTDGTYLSAWLLPSLLHEDTRYYPLGHGHSVPTRILYIISRQAMTRTYGGRETPNIAGLGGKALTQVISRTYYPVSASDFGTLSTKFGYSVMRDVGFSSIREFYPDIAAHYIKKHRAKVAAQSARDTNPTH